MPYLLRMAEAKRVPTTSQLCSKPGQPDEPTARKSFQAGENCVKRLVCDNAVIKVPKSLNIPEENKLAGGQTDIHC